ncbi:CpaF family protein [Microbacterium sp. 22195]|uniref:CpaF family protein n=1 Tax=Microbacterium sp. 22195 TaxID=3453891 RepID=UPI003F868DD3
MSHPSLVVAERVRRRLRLEHTDPSSHPDEARHIAQTEVRRHNDLALQRGEAIIDDEAALIRDVLASVSGFGALQPLLDDPEIEEIWLNGPDRIFVARDGATERLDLRLTDAIVRDLVERMLQSTGRRVDISQPFVDASLPDGSRLHVAIADVVRGSWAVNIRKFLPQHRTLESLVAQGSVPAHIAELLRGALLEGRSIIVSGATHAGKTTLLGALLASVADSQRIITVEETFELAVEGPDVVALQGRQASLEGTGEITLRRLVKEALRMRPDRIVVGEVRDAEALDLVLALNTGVPSAGTIHANSADEALEKLALLPLLAGRNIDRAFIAPALATSISYVVHCRREPDGSRRVVEVVSPTGQVADGRILTVPVHGAEGPR